MFSMSVSYRMASEKSILKNEKNPKENQNFIVIYAICDYNRRYHAQYIEKIGDST